MPLVWAHAEYIKLVCSVMEQNVFDMPQHTQERYIKNKTVSDRAIWRVNLPINILPKGKYLRIETVAPALIKWTSDDWQNVNEKETEDMGLGIHYFDLPTHKMEDKKIAFTIFWKNKNEWAGENYLVEII
jgi:glucoamylase